jgi:large repetitive protein
MPDSSLQPADIAFVFDDVADHQTLVAAFRPCVEVHVLDSGANGLAQIAQILQGRSGIGALQIVGHGSEASLHLGSLTLMTQNLDEHASVLGQIGASLVPDGDILLYGCDVAAGAAGARFVERIAQLTGAHVAASTGPTGSAALGGDWELAFRTGPVAAAAALTAAAAGNFHGLLTTNEDVNPGMTTGPGNFVPGFTLTTAQTVYDDPSNGVNGGIYFDTLTESESFTISADGTSVGTFDLAGMTWVKAFTFGEFTIDITGHRADGSTATATLYTAQNASSFSVTNDFTDMTGLVSFDVTITGTATDSSGGSTPSDLTLDAFTVNNIVLPNVAPTFVGGTATIGTTENVTAGVSAVLHVSDTDAGQTLAWSQQSAPSHGVLSMSGATAATGGTNIAPGGSITYTPTAGWAGTDTFTVKVTDGTATATRTVTVNVNPATPGAPDLAGASDSGPSNTDNITNAASLTFSGTGAAGDSSSTVRVFVDQNNNGVYDAGTDASGTAVMSNGTWTVAGLSTSAIADGTYHVYAQAASGGLTSALSTPLSVTIDHTAPVLTISSDTSTLKIGETATITFTFSEDPGATFSWDGSSGDVTVSGGTLSAISGTGSTRTAVFTPDANTNSGTASITVASGSYTDTAGNNGAAGVTPSLHFDTLAPDAPYALSLATSSDSGTSSSDGLTNVTAPTITGMAEAGATVKLYDGATQVGSGTADGSGNWAITTSTLTEGDHTLAAVAIDAAGNASTASAPLDVMIDTTAPTLAITSDVAALKAGGTAVITFTFSEDPGTTFTAGDVTVGGGTLGAISGTGLTRTAVFTPDANVNAGTASITVAHGAYTDAAGNTGAAGATPSLVFDTLAPTVTITSDVPTLKIGETATITFTFSEDPGATFTDGSIAVSGGTLSAISGSGLTRTAVFTPDANTNGGTASITVTHDSYSDAAGNGGTPGTTPSLHFDTLAPSAPSTPTLAAASDTGTSANDGLTANTTPTITGMAEAGATVKLYDGATQVGSATADGSGNWSITTSTLAEGDHTLAAVAIDAAGNASTASGALDVIIDTTAPTLAITSDVAALKAGQTATITFTFSEDPGTTFTAGDVTVGGGTLGAISGTGLTRTAVFTPDANVNAGTASITVAHGSYTDAAGNAGAAGTTPSLTFDTLAPTLAISTDVPTLKIGQTATITFTFSEDPGTTFAWDGSSGDVVVSGGTLSAISEAGLTRTAIFTPDANANAGTASITVAHGSYTDAAGNDGAAAATPSLHFDTLAPSAPSTPSLAAASDSGASASDDITNVATPTFTGTAEAGATVKLYDGATQVGSATADGSGNWSITTSTLAEGDHTLAAVAIDAAGNASTASGPLDVIIDTTAPTLAITSDVAALKAGQTATITFTFSEDPGTTFTAGDVTVGGGTLGAISGTGLTRTAVFTPDANVNAGTASITVAHGSYTDAAGNAGAAGTTPSLTFDTLAPTLAISTDVPTLKIGQTATITFTFSEDPGTTFAWDGSSGDVVVSGGTLSAISEAGLTRTAIFTPDANANAGTASITVAHGSYTDAAGNDGAAAATPSLHFDTLAPSAPSTPSLAAASDSGASASDDITNVATPTFTGTAEAGATVKLYDGATQVGSATADGSGNWSIATSTLSDGTHSISAVATDTSGNSGAASGALAVTIDTVAPAAPGTPALAAGSGTDTSTPTLTGTAEDGSTVTLYDTDGTTVLGSAVAAGGTWTITSSSLPEGAHTLAVHATDVAGNTSALSAGLALFIDTTPPSPPPAPVPGLLTGTSGDDQLTGTAGNDRIDGVGGNDTIDGGAGTDTVVVRASVSDVLSYAIDGHGVVTLTTSLGTETLTNVERVQFSDALFAVDTNPGGHLWNAAAVYHAGYGVLPGLADLSQWTAVADASDSFQAFAQKMLELHAPGVTTHDLVAALYQGVTHEAPTEAAVQYYVDQVGAGKAFATQADLVVYAATVQPNVEALATIVGTVQHLDPGAF